jgi:hypothetical protein
LDHVHAHASGLRRWGTVDQAAAAATPALCTADVVVDCSACRFGHSSFSRLWASQLLCMHGSLYRRCTISLNVAPDTTACLSARQGNGVPWA